jgi:hypothetical protein
MTLPNRPWVVQVDWADADTSPPWSDADTLTYTAAVQRIDIERRAFHRSLRSDTCSVTLIDSGFDIRPSKGSSALWPNVLLGRRLRVLAQTAPGSGVWEPWFFGYIRDYQPAPNDDLPTTTTVLADGPLAALASMQVALSPSIGAVVWDSDDPFHTGLWHLLNEAGLYGGPFLQLDNVGAVTLPDDWAGTTAEGDDPLDATKWTVKSFADWLGYLAGKAGCFVSAEPQYVVSDGDPDFLLHWYQTLPSRPTDFSWSAPAGQLEMAPQLSYNSQVTF